jgi:hypothetical protein
MSWLWPMVCTNELSLTALARPACDVRVRDVRSTASSDYCVPTSIFALKKRLGSVEEGARAVVGPSSGAQYRGFPLLLTSGKTLDGGHRDSILLSGGNRRALSLGCNECKAKQKAGNLFVG